MNDTVWIEDCFYECPGCGRAIGDIIVAEGQIVLCADESTKKDITGGHTSGLDGFTARCMACHEKAERRMNQ